VLRVCEESKVLKEILLDITTNIQHDDKTQGVLFTKALGKRAITEALLHRKPA